MLTDFTDEATIMPSGFGGKVWTIWKDGELLFPKHILPLEGRVRMPYTCVSLSFPA